MSNFSSNLKNSKISLKILSVFYDIGFLPEKTYFFFKFNFYQKFILTINKKSINLKLKMKRQQFKKQTNNAILSGFYHSVW